MSMGGDTSVRNFKIPDINLDATELQDLIEWSTEPVTEPLLTCALKDFELRDLIHTKMDIPDFPVHGQSIERCAQAVTRASSIVCGIDRREVFIRATLMHRKLVAKSNSKKDLEALLTNQCMICK